ncbi:Arc family DNA-binding protein [Brucella pseudogrignonensis]
MAKKTLVRDQDKFMLRLPEGMRERIKEKAQRAGMSMNEAIVWCLERHFPAPKTLDAKIAELAEMVALLKGDDTNKAVDDLTAEIHDVLVDIYDNKLDAPKGFKKAVEERFAQWKELEEENARYENEDPFDDVHYPDPNRERTYGDWNPESPDYDPFTTDPLPKKD